MLAPDIIRCLTRLVALKDDFSVRVLDGGSQDRVSNLPVQLRHVVDLVLVDPVQTSYSEQDEGFRSVTRLSKAISARSGKRPFYETEKSQCSSLMRPNQDVIDGFPDASRFHVVKKSTVDTLSLDDITRSFDTPFDLVKLDIQGASGRVLTHAKETLRHASAVVAEIEFMKIYKGEALAESVMSTLGRAGFEIGDLRMKYWRRSNLGHASQLRGQPVFADGLWLKPISDKHGKPTTQSCLKPCFFSFFYGLVDRVPGYAAHDPVYGPAVMEIYNSLELMPVFWGLGSEPDIPGI